MSPNVRSDDLQARLDTSMTIVPPHEPLPVGTAILTLTQNILGAGVLALPYAFKTAGLLGGVVMLGFVFVLSVLSMGALVLLGNQLGCFTYKESATATLGGRWPVVIEVCVLCYTLGICISYPILLGDFLYALANRFGLVALASKRLLMALAVVFVCWPLSCAESLGGLKWMSRLGILGILFTTVAVLLRYGDHTYDYLGERNHFEAFDFSTFGSCFPILVGAFGAHYNIPALYHEVAPEAGAALWGATQDGKAAFRRMMRVIVGAVSLSTLIYGAVGLVVYATFGDLTSSDFSENFDASDGWLVAVRLMLSLAICASFPLSLVACRNATFNIFLQPRGWVMKPPVRIAVTTALSLFCLFVACAAGEVGDVIAYNGSVFGIPVCFIAPAVMYLRLPARTQREGWRLFSKISIASGVLFGVLGVVEVTLQRAHKSGR